MRVLGQFKNLAVDSEFSFPDGVFTHKKISDTEYLFDMKSFTGPTKKEISDINVSVLYDDTKVTYFVPVEVADVELIPADIILARIGHIVNVSLMLDNSLESYQATVCSIENLLRDYSNQEFNSERF